MICSACKSRNPIGNKFCRDCGGKLTPPEGELAAEETARAEKERLYERVGGLLSAAFTLSEQKRYEQAIPIAEEAALLLPESTAAHSLLATLYEHSDEELKAIAAMERVVALNPESAADKAKLDQLRRGVHVLPRTGSAALAASSNSAPVVPATRSSSLQRSGTPYWLPFVAAGAASAVVLGLGLSLLNARTNTPRDASALRGVPVGGVSPTATTTAPNGAAAALPSAQDLAAAAQALPPGAPQKGVPPPASDVRADPFVSLGIGKPAANATLPSGVADGIKRPRTSTAGTSLPLPFRAAPAADNIPVENGSYGRTASLPPIIAVPPSNRAAGNDAGDSASPSGGTPRIAVGAPPAGSNAYSGGSSGSGSGSGDGYIRISVGPPGSSTIRSSVSSAPAPSSASSTESSLARARRMQGGGRYDEALAAYQESLSNGSGSPGEIHQGMAQCYQHQGNDGAARTEYQNAIHAYEAQAGSGRSVSAAQRGISACKAALEGLGG